MRGELDSSETFDKVAEIKLHLSCDIKTSVSSPLSLTAPVWRPLMLTTEKSFNLPFTAVTELGYFLYRLSKKKKDVA